jgi:RNA recognition motif-containing protein
MQSNSKLYVGNLSYSTGEGDLQTLFAQAGSVKSVSLITDRDTGRSKGFAFIEMTTQAEAEKAISMFNGKHRRPNADGQRRSAARNGRRVRAKPYRRRPAREPGY